MSTACPISIKRKLVAVLNLFLWALLLACTAMGTALAAPTFQAAGTGVGGTGNLTVAWPAHATDDIALLFIESRGEQAANLSVPAGFALVANSPQSTGTGGSGTRLTVYWARATSAAMPNPTIQDPGDHAVAQILTYRGVINTGNPWDVTGGGVKATASTSVSATGVTTTIPDTLVVVAVSQGFDANSTATFSNWANGNLTGINVGTDFARNNGDGGGFGVIDGVKATAGATGNTTATMTNSFANAFLTIALRPAPPTVSSITRASSNPTETGMSVSWTVVFSTSVTGVDATDFALVQAGGVSGASITSVTGSGSTWTVTANTGTGTGTLGLNLVDNDSIVSAGGTPLGGSGVNNGNFTGEVYTVSPPFCSPPSNVPAGVSVSCVCDRFGRASLNPSTIFGGNWTVSHGATDSAGTDPYINTTTGLLRLTENTNNNAKAATVPSIFPAAGNYISVEFLHYAYGGGNPGADGIALTLSDYTIPAVPGGFGGSLGYAQRTDSTPNPPGFAGGWVGIALDEYGNFQNPTEGRIGGPGRIIQSVGVRGPGSGILGYRYMGGTGGNPGGFSISANSTGTTPAPGYLYQVIVDARNSATGTINVTVNRDATTKDGSSYTSIFGPFNAWNEANYALSQGWISQIVPDYWKISFTGSTGGSTNVHEIGGLRICAQTVLPPTGGTASGFSAIDEAYPGAPTVPAYQNFQTGDIYMKLTGVPFKLWIAALGSSSLSTGYSATATKYVSVKLVDNSDNGCGPDTARTCNATCVAKTAVESGATQIATFPSGGTTGVASPSPTFTLNSAWRNLIAVMRECTTSACTAFTATAAACSADSFSVRPTGVTVVSSNATNSTTGGTPIFKAGADTFNLTATIAGVAGTPSRYTGTLKVNSTALQALHPPSVLGTVAGTFPAAVSGTPNATATGNNFTYNEVGGFVIKGYDPASNTTTPRGIYDGVAVATECAAPTTTAQCDMLRAATWTGIDSVSTKGNCVASSYSNTKDASGKYGCLFGLTADSAGVGRFTPAFFDVIKINACLSGTPFTYSGQPFSQVKVSAMAAGSPATAARNYNPTTGLSKDVTLSDGNGFTGGAYGNGTFPASGFTSNGDQTRTDVSYAFSMRETPPITLKLRATDSDNVSSNNPSATEDTAEIRSGRLRIQNAYGSELAALPVPMRAEYYVDTTITAPATTPSSIGWVTNTADSCTQIPATSLSLSNNVAPSPVSPPTLKNIGTKNTLASVTFSPLSGGDAGLSLSAPGQGGDGYVDITANLSARPWLRFDWNGTGDVDPSGRASFGLYRGSPRHIYLRQRYN